MIPTIKARAAQRIKDLSALALDAKLLEGINTCAWQCISALRDGHKILLFGNGGSAAQAQHWAAELVGTFRKKDRVALPAIALTTDGAILTALGNDRGFGDVFQRQVAALAQAGDVAIGISTSGNSLNVIVALDLCVPLGVSPWLLTGPKFERIMDEAQFVLRCPGDDTAAIQESHLFVAHLICEAIDDNVG